MRIAVGSNNPVKIQAVSTVVLQAWPAATIHHLAVPSGVSDMPMSDRECIHGALTRASAARTALDADLGLGLEGGVQPVDGKLFLVGWVAAVDHLGRENYACAARLCLPARLSAAIQSGRELGPLLDELTGRQHTNHAEGAIGILTRKLMTRQRSFQVGVTYALAPWLTPEWYHDA